MVTRLSLLNGALQHLGPVRLTSETENRPDRKDLDAVYEDTKQAMLEAGIWFFALRTIRWDADTDVEPEFGLPYAFSFPDDFVRIRHISPDERQETEDQSYKREGDYLYSDYDTLYLTYVSNDAAYGGDLGKFTQLYADAFSADLAYRSGLPITKDGVTKANLEITAARLLARAKRKDAVDERVKGKPLSSWVTSRRGFGSAKDQRREPT